MSRRDMADQESPFEDDYRGFDVREDDTARGPLILAIAAGVLIIFVGVIWNTYRQGVRPAAGDIPKIYSDVQPFKHPPEDPGGQPVPHREMTFYNAMESGRAGAAAEEPPAPLAGGDMQLLEANAPRDLRPAPLAIPGDRPAASVQDEPPAAQQPAAAVADAPVAEPPRLAVTLRPPEPVEPLAAKARFTFTENGQFLVQLAAHRSEEAAETAWKRLTASSPELYHGATKRIQRADLGAEGVFYRLRVGAFAERAEAVAFCDAVKQSGATCIVVTG
ncbi:SPOR domain-containing protein [Hyphomonas sp.]|uniref:SPOR domain-containing protein n=1 Tax=Hyphomonas sp. TaxID=87 RepID=UPI00391AAD7B